MTTVIAIWGALLSTMLAVRQFLQDRPRVRVLATPVFDMRQPEGHEQVWHVQVVNTRNRPVEIMSVGVMTPRYRRYQPTSAPANDHRHPEHFPVIVAPHHSISCVYELEGGHSRDALVGAWAMDIFEREYRAAYPRRNPRAYFRMRRLTFDHRREVRAVKRAQN
jgi:hypothetical protein